MGVAPPQVTKCSQQDDDRFTIRTTKRAAAVPGGPSSILFVPLFGPQRRQISMTASYLYIAPGSAHSGPAGPKAVSTAYRMH
jgi:hypothetical protein